MANAVSGSSPEFKFYRLSHLKEMFGVSGSSIWGWVRAGTFPKPVKLSKNCTAWRAAQIDEWVQHVTDTSGEGA